MHGALWGIEGKGKMGTYSDETKSVKCMNEEIGNGEHVTNQIGTEGGSEELHPQYGKFPSTTLDALPRGCA